LRLGSTLILSTFFPAIAFFTRKVEPELVKTISIDNEGTHFDMSLFKEESIEWKWKIIGEQSEWLLNRLNAFKETVTIPTSYIERFMYYYTDMTGLVLRRR
jgi:hypothetical protein